MRLRKHKKSGFTLVELMIVVSIIGFLAVIAMPNFMKTRLVAQEKICISNLRVIETAKQMWGMEWNKGASDVPAEDELVGPLLYMRRMPTCPAQGEYDFLNLDAQPECTITGHEIGNSN